MTPKLLLIEDVGNVHRPGRKSPVRSSLAEQPGASLSRHLITSALPYINGIKHLGNLVGSMLPADVYARFQRASGEEVLFICATDEHGTPAELAAAEAGQDVAEFCAEQHEIQQELCERVRPVVGLVRPLVPSPEPRAHPALRPRSGGRRLLSRSGSTDQVYSIADKRFLPDRYVDRHLPALRLRPRPRRPVRELQPAARSRPT